MENNENMVVMQAKEEKAIRKILQVIEECTGITILLAKEPFRMIVSLDNDIMMNIIKMLIMENLLNAVSIQPYHELEGQQIVPEVSKEEQAQETITQKPIKKETQESNQESSKKPDLKEEARLPATQKTKEEKKTAKERILLFMQQEARVLTNAEINENIGKMRSDYLNECLMLLCKQGKVEKVARGKWKAKGVEEVSVTTKEGEQSQKNNEKEVKKAKKKSEETKKQDEEVEKETKEKNVKKENHEVTEQDVLNIFQAKGWQMTQEEVVKKLKAKPDTVVKILDTLVESKKLQKEGENYKIYKSPFGIFEEKTYSVLLDYIMGQSHFIEGGIKNKFPQEAHKLEELLKQMGQKYIQEQQNAKGSYNVYLKGRILYYVMKHPNADLGDIRHAFPTISSQEISNSINIALRNKELQRNATTRTFVTVTM